MIVKSRGSFFVLFFICLSSLFSQNNDGSSIKHRIAWTKDDYALRYEVIIEREEKNEYSPVLQEFTEDPFIFISLPPGYYRLRVISYDFRDIPGAGTAWKNFRVFAVTGLDSESQLVMDDASHSAQEEGSPPESAAGQAGTGDASTPVVEKKQKDFFIGLFAEGIGYSRYGAAFGGGIVFGGSYDNLGFGISLLYAKDEEKFVFVEALANLRLYISRVRNNTGFFLQPEGGFVVFAHEDFGIGQFLALEWGVSLVGGISAGWRYPLGAYFYVEPVIRGGYPYIFGASLTAGIRF